MMKGYFDTIPVEIDEAGRVDGLTPFGTFWRLILPLARPGLAVTAFYTFITAWAEVAYASAFMIGEEKYTLAVGLQTFVSQHGAQWGLMAAAAVLIAIPRRRLFYLRAAAPGHRADRRRHQVLTRTTRGTRPPIPTARAVPHL